MLDRSTPTDRALTLEHVQELSRSEDHHLPGLRHRFVPALREPFVAGHDEGGVGSDGSVVDAPVFPFDGKAADLRRIGHLCTATASYAPEDLLCPRPSLVRISAFTHQGRALSPQSRDRTY